MVAILKFAILDSAILDKTLTQTNSIWLKLIHSHSTWWGQPSWILPSTAFDSAILRFTQKTLTQSDSLKLTIWLIWLAAILNSAILDPAILHKTLTQTHSFSLNLMMSAILNSAMIQIHSDTAILDSDTLLSSLRFTQKHSHSHSTLTQTNSICTKSNFPYSFSLNLMMAAILNSAILDSAHFDSAILSQNSDSN